ncbi:oligopeptide transport system permease protein [Lachnospiraceae bacterium XBB1006]|nr:oligopeptide transport system permease protein [Lachnospiraceae bacterium XBB1006]
MDSRIFTVEEMRVATPEEKQSVIVEREVASFWSEAWGRLKANKVAMVALVIIILYIVLAFVGPVFIPYTYAEQIRGAENLRPFTYSQTEMIAKEHGATVFPHIFGTDSLGRDFLVRILYGTRVSLAIGVVASLIVLVIGSIYGSIAGYVGGKTDVIMMRVVDVIYSVPEVLVVLLLQVVLKTPLDNWFSHSQTGLANFMNTLGTGLISIFITFGILYWVGMARIIRGQILTLKQQEYVTAARSIGAKGKFIIKKHLLPNCIGQLIVTTCLQIPSAIFLESFLSFLGLGVSAPLASLGSLASDGLKGIYTYTYRLIIPSLVLSIMILALNLFGDGLRDALDPRLKK